MTQAEIDSLIICKKFISAEPRRKAKANGAHEENELQLTSGDHSYRFRVFLRRNLILPESFSIGLIFRPQDEARELRLLRCNGDHGGHRNPDGTAIAGAHIHKARAELLELDVVPDAYAETTREYASLEEAIYFFFSYTNVLEWERFFPNALYWGLFQGGDN